MISEIREGVRSSNTTFVYTYIHALFIFNTQKSLPQCYCCTCNHEYWFLGQ